MNTIGCIFLACYITPFIVYFVVEEIKVRRFVKRVDAEIKSARPGDIPLIIDKYRKELASKCPFCGHEWEI